MKKYKYLVVCGCSLSYGLDCPVEQTYPKLLADRLGLELINLSTPGIGWVTLQSNVISFINNNQNIIDECFFIFQQSLLGRELDYECATGLYKTDVWEKWNIKFISISNVTYHGFIDWNAYLPNNKPEWWDSTPSQNRRSWSDSNHVPGMLRIIPEHRYGINHLKHMIPSMESIPYIQEQFEQVMLHWASLMASFHLLLKNINVDHIIVDGYIPTVSYKLNFTNYEEYFYKLGKAFYSNNNDSGDALTYDFKNIRAGWIFDKIDSKYKIDDVILWGLFGFRRDKLWNLDGVHAGPLGMRLIEEVLYKNLVDKGWVR